MSTSRRDFIKKTGLASASIGLGLNMDLDKEKNKAPLFKISLAEWSINRPLFSGKIDHLDFPILSKKHGIDAIEYVNQFFKDKAEDKAYLREMKFRADNEGVRSVLIMCDGEGQLGAKSEKERNETVDNHKKWVTAAKYLGCHCIRVNGYSTVKWSKDQNAFEESQKYVADGLHKLCEFADAYDMDVVIENHGGFSSNGAWLAGTIKKADHKRAGTLPDFGNFRISRDKDGNNVSYDTYEGVEELMPFARGVSVKTTAWDHDGNQSALDYEKITRVVLDTEYRGYFGIEHGEKDREWESIVEVKEELMKVRDLLRGEYK